MRVPMSLDANLSINPGQNEPFTVPAYSGTVFTWKMKPRLHRNLSGYLNVSLGKIGLFMNVFAG
jgi:hypothetical protein